jgi:hypothetical protein
MSVTTLKLDFAKNVDAASITRMLKNNPRLTSVSLFNIFHVDGGDGLIVLESLQSNVGLKELSLGCNSLSRNTARWFHKHPHAFSSLTSLVLSSNALRDDGVKWICSWLRSSSPSLTLFDLGVCRIESKGARRIAAFLLQNTTLETLYLPLNDLGDVGVRCIGKALERNSTLSSLSLMSTSMTDDGVASLAVSLAKNTSLTWLDISDNKCTPEHGSAKLLEMLEHSNTSLRHLYYDEGNSDRLNNQLERNHQVILAAKRAVVCLIACHQFRREEFSLGALNMVTIGCIARYVWALRKSREWLKASKE